MRTDDATKDSEETATALTVSIKLVITGEQSCKSTYQIQDNVGYNNYYYLLYPNNIIGDVHAVIVILE